ncbi:hypothetical protein Mterra_03271 [Calidithermus terrae]|uniref:Uncharacterized protein n=1 Tax=Calidithermus terrae TaxID=1408545 RepID=A0A399EBU1_9DEIN|nr:hypothetical protein Mterra_03271 [Calidithermus terrae]
MLPRQDVDGFLGARYVGDCGVEYKFPPSRYLGGLAHELGHAFGLPHPGGCGSGSNSCDAGSVMWTGYASYFSQRVKVHLRIAALKALKAVQVRLASNTLAHKPRLQDAIRVMPKQGNETS